MPLYRQHDFNWGRGSTRVLVGTDLLAEVGTCFRELGGFTRGLLVTDDQVPALYAATVAGAMSLMGYDLDLAILPAGDGSKSLEQASRLYDRLAEFGVARDGFMVAVGGGMVTDLVGFVAATWLRGITTVLCPTTLEADIDASIGGKTGVNHQAGKNLIGAFHHPRLVVIDTACLATLSDRDLRAGMAESIKHAVITGEPFMGWHEANVAAVLTRDHAVLADMIDRNVTIKAGIVASDERDTSGRRAVLNFGHTIGHAIEAVLTYQWRHGECVALGMVAACRLSQSLELLGDKDCGRIVGLLESFGLPVRMRQRIDAETVWDFMQHDKKVYDASVHFILLKALGQPVSHATVSASAIRSAIAAIQPP